MKTKLLYIVLLASGLAAPFFVYPVFAMQALCVALFACAFNLLLGFTGLLSFGHATFFGTAGYFAGYAIKKGLSVDGIGLWGFNIPIHFSLPPFTPELGILFGTLVAGVLGYIVGSLAIRRQGIYFAMITLALSQLVYFIYLQVSFTGGEDGLQGVPRGDLFGVISLKEDMVAYYVVYAIFLFGFWLIHRTIHSPFGQVLKAIRENEPRALSLGYDVDQYKLIAFVISTALAGLAGATKTMVLGAETLTDVHWHASGEVVLMTLLGGLGTIFGPVVGAFTIVTLQNQLSDKVGSWVTVIMGSIFVICVLAFRRGIVGELKALFERKQSST